MQAQNPDHRWRFFRSGGFDQVQLETAADLQHLAELDPKLWCVLACPTTGLEFAADTLAYLDQNQDGRIRVPEILAATQWVCRILKDVDLLFTEGDNLPLSALNTEEAEGAALRATAQQILHHLNKSEASEICVSDLKQTQALFTPEHLNGDGIVPRALVVGESVQALFDWVLNTRVPRVDRSGEPGIDLQDLEDFLEEAQQVLDWQTLAEKDSQLLAPLGESTPEALACFERVKDKIEDYFTRARLLAFDDKAAPSLNPTLEQYQALSEQCLQEGLPAISALPLAALGHVSSDQPLLELPLHQGLNPAWAEALHAFYQRVLTPVYGEMQTLSWSCWQDLKQRFVAYQDWLALRPNTQVVECPLPLLRQFLGGTEVAILKTLLQQDLEATTAAAWVDALQKLLCYRRDLVRLLRNYVNFADFYSQERKAIFQAGILYLDQRSCDLCIRVNNLERHTQLAPLSGAYLVYCQCQREGENPFTLVAAMTGGDVDEMMVPGRNGIFYDRQGQDWHASVIKVVENPISVRQAFWSPYKRIARMIGDQLQKLAAAKDKAIEEKAAVRLGEVSQPTPTPAFDIAKFAGIFAAIGLALGALGTALAAVISSLLQLPVWQFPLVILGAMLVISGPAMLMASLKLRRRNLGPLLDANGWAVNTRAQINLAFGAYLTSVARLPQGAERRLRDPYAPKSRKKLVVLFILLGVLLLVWLQLSGLSGWLDGWLDG